MADEPKPEEQSFLKRLLARKPKPEKPFNLYMLQDLPYDDTPLPDSRNSKEVAGVVPAAIGGMGPVSAADIIRPTQYDLLVRRLDKRALQILQARLEKLRSYKDLVKRTRRDDWEGSDEYCMVGKTTTVNETRDHGVEMYAAVMEGDESLPKVIESLERFIQEGGRKKLDKNVGDDLRGSIIVACRRYHWVENSVRVLELWENKYRDEQRRAKKEEDRERQSHGVQERSKVTSC